MRVVGISGSLRAGSHNTALLAAAAASLPAGVEFREWRGLALLPAYDEGGDGRHAPAGRRRPAADDRGCRRRADRDARVQRLDPGCAQERAGLGVATVPRQLPSRQAGRRRRRQHWDVRRRLGSGRASQGVGHDRRRRPRRGAVVPAAHAAFTPDGRLRDPALAMALRRLVRSLLEAPARRAA